jgi:hypothetical protein
MRGGSGARTVEVRSGGSGLRSINESGSVLGLSRGERREEIIAILPNSPRQFAIDQ